MGNNKNSNAAHDDMHEEGGHHIVPQKYLNNVAIALVVLTVLTVVTGRFVETGILHGPIAFAIAGVKAMLVMMYFMGLKYDTKINRVIFGSGFVFLGLLFFFCFIDIITRYSQSSTL